MKISKDTIMFFNAEIRNEKEGGISPSNLESAEDSLSQGYNPSDSCNLDIVEKEIDHLIKEHGTNKNLIDLMAK